MSDIDFNTVTRAQLVRVTMRRLDEQYAALADARAAGDVYAHQMSLELLRNQLLMCPDSSGTFRVPK